MGERLKWGLSKTIVVDKTLYSSQLKKMVTYIGEAALLLSRKEEYSCGEELCADDLPANTVVGIVGERGSGKTSFLYTLRDSLPKSCFPLRIVDPSNFESQMSALELFVARLYEEYKRIYKKRAASSEFYEAPFIHQCFKDLAKTLSSIRSGASVYSRDFPSMEVLEHMVDLVGIQAKIRQLCTEFLNYVNSCSSSEKKEYIVMMIDDVDLIENHKVFRLLEDVRKFLSGNVVIVLTYREKQLGDSVLDRKLGENERLVRAGVTNRGELQLQMEDFIEKVVPLDRTVRLKDQADIINERALTVLGALHEDGACLRQELIDPYAALGLSEDATMGEWIDVISYAKTLLMVRPVNSQEETAFVWPRNLRETISLAKLLHCDLAKPTSDSLAESLPTYMENLSSYQDYVMGRLGEAFDSSLYDVIDRWRRASNPAKNYTAYSFFYERLLEVATSTSHTPSSAQEEMLSNLLDASLLRPENVTLGDVVAMLNSFIQANYNDESLVHLGYSFKLLYSIELLGCLLESLRARKEGTDSSQSDERYLTLLNSCVISPEPEGSPLSHAMLYPQYGDGWRGLELEGHGLKCVVEEAEVQKVMLALCCSPVPLPKDTSKAGIYTLSRPTRGMHLEERRYGWGNRPLFTIRNVNPLKDEVTDMEKSSRPDRLTRYPVNVLNILGKKWYLEAALQKVLAGTQGAYLFYNLGDIDVFEVMRMEPRRKAEGAEHQMKRLNTAVVFHLVQDSVRFREEAGDGLLMEILVPFERQSLRRLHAPFVVDASYRLFGSDSSCDLISFREIDKVFRFASDLEALVDTSGYGRPGLGLRKYIQTEGKVGIGKFSDCLAVRLKAREEMDASQELDAIVSRLEKANTRPSAGEREVLMTLAERYPIDANEAFKEVYSG